MKHIALLGATGSIGIQTTDVIRNHPEEFNLFAMAFRRNVEKALPLIREFDPEIIVVQSEETKAELIEANVQADVLVGSVAMKEIATHDHVDVLVNAVMGSVGLEATLGAIESRKQVALANKETLVTAGHLVMEAAKRNGVDILPVDSEHSAIYQCLNGENHSDIHKLTLTASGGSFRDKARSELEGVTVEDALNHPNWSMGAKITIDSATMMNKGLEVIEAHWLFDIPYDDIDVIQHRESVIHSMVEFNDKSVMAQLGTPDMRVPIQYALTYPNRLEMKDTKTLNLVEIGKLHFEEMDFERFPCLRMAYEAGRAGGTMPTVLNAANEQAVALFLEGDIDFLRIESLIERALSEHELIERPSLETIVEVDQETRARVKSYVK
ncbi:MULTISPECIES: 1-deoxy-D-xylulose-5-phosphate reductoisomerase [Pontibacillus]|uniref:1-deoxy-D-xylulose 5-phosphate reductoisomerase n=1 Tax=Pontibacillus chungwhensis TaxID=265426 RepID=A0ABY8V3Z0_9BACI|nr:MULTISPECIES: 1-deoxy-D-xylulose-5-phosphate reductoisomerase [Pontibacillus]MCD5322718.1 1-deoxy-D-xylulose-5-phosphate reductoisomerase [Pontibacillus sp. HN14]WIG00179.1 1-deoxy-D-xylulose-5-phosphate reductoisomerase [Pontibacillus chungwhensis]